MDLFSGKSSKEKRRRGRRSPETDNSSSAKETEDTQSIQETMSRRNPTRQNPQEGRQGADASKEEQKGEKSKSENRSEEQNMRHEMKDIFLKFTSDLQDVKEHLKRLNRSYKGKEEEVLQEALNLQEVLRNNLEEFENNLRAARYLPDEIPIGDYLDQADEAKLFLGSVDNFISNLKHEIEGWSTVEEDDGEDGDMSYQKVRKSAKKKTPKKNQTPRVPPRSPVRGGASLYSQETYPYSYGKAPEAEVPKPA